MSTVFLALDRSNMQHVAIKLLEKRFSADESHIEDFLNETRNLLQLDHENIVKVVEGFHVGEWLGYVMEYVEGDTVDTFLNGIKGLDHRSIHDICVNLLNALDYLHENGIVHMDIKPSNLLVRNDGVLKLIDLGVSKAVSPYAKGFETTNRESIAGTLMYMSPEQLKSSRYVDHHSDIYSVGIMLWEMIEGRHPYHDMTEINEVVKSIRSQTLPETGTFWDPVIKKATQKSPSKRYASAYTMNLAITRAYEDRDKIRLPSRSILSKIYDVRELSAYKKSSLLAICLSLGIKVTSSINVSRMKDLIVSRNLKHAELEWLKTPDRIIKIKGLMKSLGIPMKGSLHDGIESLKAKIDAFYTLSQLQKIQSHYLPVILRILNVNFNARSSDKRYREVIAMHNMRKVPMSQLTAYAKRRGFIVYPSREKIMFSIYNESKKSEYQKQPYRVQSPASRYRVTTTPKPATFREARYEKQQKLHKKEHKSLWDRIISFFT